MVKRAKRKIYNKRKFSKKLRKNPAALISALLVLVSGFIFQVFHQDFLGESIPDKRLTIVNYAIDFFSNSFGLNSSLQIMSLVLVLLYFAIFFLYLFNGLGLIYNRYSRYASFTSFVYLVFGLILYSLLNQQYATSFFGFEMTSISIGAGIYFIPIIGVLYLVFKRQINSAIRL